MENKYKVYQSIFKWLVTFIAMIIVFWFCYSNRSAIPNLVFQICMWIAVIGIGLGLVVSLGICIWFYLPNLYWRLILIKKQLL